MRGSLVQRGKDRWAVVLDLPKGPDGKRRQKWITVRGNRRTAEARLTKEANAANEGRLPTARRGLTVGTWLDQWLASARADLAGTTAERYAGLVADLQEVLGAVKLTALTPATVREAIADLGRRGRRTKAGGRDASKPLSAETLRQARAVLRSALGMAVEDGVLVDNPAASKRRRKGPRAVKRKIVPPDAAGVVRLFRALADTPLLLPITLAMALGLRRGELLALRWSDINFDTRTVWVRRALEETKATGLRFKEVKDKEERVLRLPAFAVEPLMRHRAEQAKQQHALGADYHDADLVVALPDGRPLSPDSFSGAFGRTLKRAGLPHMRLHDLRHAFASLLIAEGADPKTVSDLLGHSTTAFTMDVYGHLFDAQRRAAADKLDAALGRAAAVQPVETPALDAGQGPETPPATTATDMAAATPAGR